MCCLGGECNLEFWPTRTEFTLALPATIQLSTTMITSFILAQGTHVVFLDDCPLQRKLFMAQHQLIFQTASSCQDRGSSAAEIKGFCAEMTDYILSRPTDRFLFICDENLDYTCEETGLRESMSGSIILSELRNAIGPSAEQNILALVRSANDSKSDKERFHQRAHGFVSKLARKAAVREQLATMWYK